MQFKSGLRAKTTRHITHGCVANFENSMQNTQFHERFDFEPLRIPFGYLRPFRNPLGRLNQGDGISRHVYVHAPIGTNPSAHSMCEVICVNSVS